MRTWTARCAARSSARCRKPLTLRYHKVPFILDPVAFLRRSGKNVVVCDYPDGRLEIMEGDTSLPYRTFDKLRSVHRSEIVENKRLDEAFAMVAEMLTGRDLQRSQHGPPRTGQENHMFGMPMAARATVTSSAAANGFHERLGCHRAAGTGAGKAGRGRVSGFQN